MKCRQPSFERPCIVRAPLVKEARRIHPSRIEGLVIAAMETSVRQDECRDEHQPHGHGDSRGVCRTCGIWTARHVAVGVRRQRGLNCGSDGIRIAPQPSAR